LRVRSIILYGENFILSLSLSEPNNPNLEPPGSICTVMLICSHVDHVLGPWLIPSNPTHQARAPSSANIHHHRSTSEFRASHITANRSARWTIYIASSSLRRSSTFLAGFIIYIYLNPRCCPKWRANPHNGQRLKKDPRKVVMHCLRF